MAADQKDVVDMDEYEWRAWLRSVTPFIDGDMVRYLFKGYEPDDFLSIEIFGDSRAFWTQLPGMDLDGVFDYFTVHCINWRDRRDAVYAVHTNVKKSSAGRVIEIKYWPHMGALLNRLGYENGECLLKNQWDGTALSHVGPLDLVTLPAFFHNDPQRAEGETGNDLLMMIEHEINSAWFHEPADLEREALREESEKANPAPKDSGRAGRL
ncbi:hypothetical protein [Massilia sp. NP310]|uniref:hypothetical protein n=1 Tax=Massilia sp. NP310 TaxID=2861282 RepID=UPI001C6331AB|nr:hypothetical protein [Massilia sp. NP310]QYG04047.1 hypothetical protein KY496_12015 [Massilia sp. NP310]